MESFESSMEPRTLCSAALSCGGVRSPGRLGRSPGAYAAGPSPQSSPTLSRGGSGRPGTSHDPCSVMLTRRSFVLPPRGPVLPTDVTGVTLGMTTDSDDGPPRAGIRPLRQTHRAANLGAPAGVLEAACPQGLGITGAETWTTRPPLWP